MKSFDDNSRNPFREFNSTEEPGARTEPGMPAELPPQAPEYAGPEKRFRRIARSGFRSPLAFAASVIVASATTLVLAFPAEAQKLAQDFGFASPSPAVTVTATAALPTAGPQSPAAQTVSATPSSSATPAPTASPLASPTPGSSALPTAQDGFAVPSEAVPFAGSHMYAYTAKYASNASGPTSGVVKFAIVFVAADMVNLTGDNGEISIWQRVSDNLYSSLSGAYRDQYFMEFTATGLHMYEKAGLVDYIITRLSDYEAACAGTHTYSYVATASGSASEKKTGTVTITVDFSSNAFTGTNHDGTVTHWVKVSENKYRCTDSIYENKYFMEFVSTGMHSYYSTGEVDEMATRIS